MPPTMADLMLTRSCEPPEWETDIETSLYSAIITVKARDAIESFPTFVVNNVADHVWGIPRSEREALDTGMIPPFPVFWMEYRRPAWMYSPHGGERTRTNTWEDDSYGCLVVCTDLDAMREGRMGDLGGALVIDPEATLPSGERMIDALPEEGRWFYQMALVLLRPGGHLVGPVLYRMVCVDEYGDVVGGIGPTGTGNNWLGIPGDKERTPEMRDHITGKYSFAFTPFEAALFFMNTRGIEHKPNPPRRKENQQYQKKHGRGLLTYKTLVVETVVGGNGTHAGTHIVKSEHIVRGHKADYRKGAGLFGKYKVLIYRAAHTAGSREAGRVDKDYEVKPPRKTA